MLMSLFFSNEDVLKEMKFADPVVFKWLSSFDPTGISLASVE